MAKKDAPLQIDVSVMVQSVAMHLQSIPQTAVTLMSFVFLM